MTQMLGSLINSQRQVMGKIGDPTKTATITSLLLSTGGTTLQTYIYLFCIISKTENLRKPRLRRPDRGKMGTKITLFLLPHTPDVVRFYTCGLSR